MTSAKEREAGLSRTMRCMLWFEQWVATRRQRTLWSHFEIPSDNESANCAMIGTKGGGLSGCRRSRRRETKVDWSSLENWRRRADAHQSEGGTANSSQADNQQRPSTLARSCKLFRTCKCELCTNHLAIHPCPVDKLEDVGSVAGSGPWTRMDPSKPSRTNCMAAYIQKAKHSQQPYDNSGQKPKRLRAYGMCPIHIPALSIRSRLEIQRAVDWWPAHGFFSSHLRLMFCSAVPSTAVAKLVS